MTIFIAYDLVKTSHLDIFMLYMFKIKAYQVSHFVMNLTTTTCY